MDTNSFVIQEGPKGSSFFCYYTVIPNQMSAYNTTANREFVYKVVLNMAACITFYTKKKQTVLGLPSVIISYTDAIARKSCFHAGSEHSSVCYCKPLIRRDNRIHADDDFLFRKTMRNQRFNGCKLK